jgi:predicted HNH restriction endonuclease
MKNLCDKCGFKSPHSDVFSVFHVDGDLNNCRHANLKTICANCARVLHKEGIRWRQGDLTPDL